MTKIEKSIVATGGSSISNSTNEVSKKIKRIKFEYTIIGFILGILSSIIAAFIYSYLTSS